MLSTHAYDLPLSDTGDVPDPRPEIGIAVNMEVVISCMVAEVVVTASGARPAAALDDGINVEMIGNAARYCVGLLSMFIYHATFVSCDLCIM